MQDGISGTVRLAPNGNRLNGSMQILNYHKSNVTQVGVIYFGNDTALIMDRDALYLRGAYYLPVLRPPLDCACEAGKGSMVVAAVVPAVSVAALVAAAVAGCCWWRRRWPSREELLARRNKWAVRGILTDSTGGHGCVDGH
jgi:hypothetical protein